jgi:hypothetical protein
VLSGVFTGVSFDSICGSKSLVCLIKHSSGF